MNFSTSKYLISQAQSIFHKKESFPFYVKRAKGVCLYDFDQNKFIDFFLNQGSLILGHAHPKITRGIKNFVSRGYQYSLPTHLELRLAKLIIECYPSIETIRFTDSKDHVVNELINMVQRLTGKKKILFVGAGYERKLGEGMDILSHFDTTQIDAVLSKSHKEIGAICLEPIATTSGLVIHNELFWDQIREITSRYQLFLILDEEITGFRLALGGGAEFFNITPDISILGSIVGGGFPLYAYGGKEEYFDMLSPNRLSLYHPIHYICGIETIKLLKRENRYAFMESLVKTLCSKTVSGRFKVQGIASIFSISHSEGAFNQNDFQNRLLEHQLFLYPPFQQSHFISTVHTEHDVSKLIDFLNK